MANHSFTKAIEDGKQEESVVTAAQGMFDILVEAIGYLASSIRSPSPSVDSSLESILRDETTDDSDASEAGNVIVSKDTAIKHSVKNHTANNSNGFLSAAASEMVCEVKRNAENPKKIEDSAKIDPQVLSFNEMIQDDGNDDDVIVDDDAKLIQDTMGNNNKKNIFLVPTKSGKERLNNNARSEPVNKRKDPFLFYSVEENRMNAILGLDEDDGPSTVLLQDSSNISNNQGNSQASIIRKTKLSFEVHSLVIFDRILDEIESEEF